MRRNKYSITKDAYDAVAKGYADNAFKKQWMKSYIDETFRDLPKGSTILDLGCGPGNDSSIMIQNGFKVVGVDFSEEMIKEGLVSEIKATLFRAIPSVYPLTYTGATNLSLSPDEQKIVYVVAGTEKKSGVWVWQLTDRPINIGRGSGPQQLALASSGYDYTRATFKWSPDSRQIMVTLADRTLLLESDRLNDPPKDITPTLNSILNSWDQDTKERNLTRLNLIKDLNLKKEASSAAFLKWSPDESKYLISSGGVEDFKVVDLETSKTHSLPKATNYSWLPDSDHVILVEGDSVATDSAMVNGKISIVEYDGFNKAEIYAGRFDLKSVVAWPDSSRLMVISSYSTITASNPNLFGINLK